MTVTRRQVLVAFAVGTLGLLVGFPSSGARRKRRRKIYRLSSRGRRASKAVKIHNANLRFRSKRIAKHNRVHPGDTSRVVPLVVSAEEFTRLFGKGATRRKVVDLRAIA
jgi:DNA-binding PadR family transcriptional regulator